VGDASTVGRATGDGLIEVERVAVSAVGGETANVLLGERRHRDPLAGEPGEEGAGLCQRCLSANLVEALRNLVAEQIACERHRVV
jgi:hypothetical protein